MTFATAAAFLAGLAAGILFMAVCVLWRMRKPSEAVLVCYEAYQAVGSMLMELDAFETDKAEKILDNLSEARLVHDDVLPWPSFRQVDKP